MTKPLTDAEKAKGSKKTVNKKEYHWCPHHSAWTRHKPSKCRLQSKDSGKSAPGKEEQKNNASNSKDKTLQLSEAIAAVLQDRI